MRTRIPLTLANIVYCTHAPRKKAQRWLDDMVKEGVVEVDADDAGELIWEVRGAARAAKGPTAVEDWDKVPSTELATTGSNTSLAASGAALLLASRAGKLLPTRKDGDKSLVASGLLSFFLGPIGWLYAAPLSEAIPVIVIYAAICAIFPGFLLKMLLPLIGPVSALAGVAYAWKHNSNGKRTPLLGTSEDPALPPKR